MIVIKVTEKDKNFALKQIENFAKIKQGAWRYKGVEAWRGIVCEMLASKYFEANYDVKKPAKGLDSTGVIDDCDMVIGTNKIEIKSATKNYFKYIMPKVNNVNLNPKDYYIGVKYNETTDPNEVQIIGWIAHLDIIKFPIKKNKGAAYYEVPFNKLKLIKQK